MEFCNTENETGLRVIRSGYYNHRKHGTRKARKNHALTTYSRVFRASGTLL